MVFMKKVGVIMGSDSDLPVVEKAMDKLKEYGVPYEVHVYSAHRTPEQAGTFARTAQEKGFGVIIGAAGKAPTWPVRWPPTPSAGDWHPGEVLHPGWAGCTALHRSNAHGHSGSHCGHRWGANLAPPWPSRFWQSPMRTWRTGSARPEPQSPKKVLEKNAKVEEAFNAEH